MYSKAKNLLYRFWNSEGRKVWHTFWQVAGGALITGLLAAHSTADAKLALTSAIAVGLAALKAAYLTQKG